MSIDDQPMNVYWSGKRTETVNRSKINYKGSVATFSDLPDIDNQKGDMYSVTGLNGENYIWDGTVWDALGTSDANVLHKTGEEEAAGKKTFTNGVVSYSAIEVKNNTYAMAEPPSSFVNSYFLFTDKNGVGVSCIQHHIKASLVETKIVANKPGDTTTAYRSAPGVCVAVDNNNACSFVPVNLTSGTMKLGRADSSWSEVFAANGTINTSDERFKTSIQPVPEIVLDAWADVEWSQFQMLDAVEKKGDEARLHAGAVAQRIDAVFRAHGLDASRYGLFCYDEWAADEESGVQSGGRYSLRYTEALCVEAAYQRRRADRAEARLAMLEERLSALEARYPE